MSTASGPIEISRSANPFATDAVTREADGVPHYADLPASLPAMLRAHVDTVPDREAVVELGGARLTYRELWEAARRVAGGLHARGCAGGDRVAIRYPAGVDWVLAFWGTLLAGGVPVAVNIRLAPPEVDYVLTDSGTSIDLAPGAALPDGEPPAAPELALTDDAALFYTSGTLGRPKGVPITHEAFLTNARNMLSALGLSERDGAQLRTLISVPLFHVTGCNSQLLTAAYAGGTSVLMPALDLPALIAALPQERISFLVTVPAVYALLLRHPALPDADVSSVRQVGYGGAPIAPTLVLQLKDAFGSAQVFNGYGMTETASLLTVLPDQEAVEHADSIGYAVPSVDLAIDPIGDDPNTGELLARGGNVLREYWNHVETNEAAFVDGWLRTGDVVHVDDAGRLRIVDRVKDIINRGGENVSSIEVEDVLSSAPGVAEAAVIAVPDEVMGEKVGAVVVGLHDPLDVDAVLVHCRERLADYKVPQFISVVLSPLPRNAGGKLVKARLRDEVSWGPALR